MALIERKEFWDVRDLAELAEDNYAIVVDPEAAADEVSYAKDILRVMGEALKSFGRSEFYPETEDEYPRDEEDDPFVYGFDIADQWKKIGDEVHVTIILDSYMEEYVESLADDFGWFPPETPDFIVDAVDWAKVADTLKGNYEAGDFNLDGNKYWINVH